MPSSLRLVEIFPPALCLSALIACCAAGLLVFGFRAAADHGWLLAWAVGVVLAHLLRLALGAWGRARRGAAVRMQAAITLIAGVAWGVLPILLPAAAHAAAGLVLALLTGVVALELFMTPDPRGRQALLFGVPVLLGQLVALAVSGAGPNLPLALAWWFAAAIMLTFADGFGKLKHMLRVRTRSWRALLAERDTLFAAEERGVLLVRSGLIVDCNLAFARLFGYERGELINQSAERLFTVESGGPRRWRHRAGHPLEVEVRARELHDAGGAPLELALFSDISTLRALERGVVAYRDRVRNAIDAMPWGIWDHDVATGIFFYSGRFRAILALPGPVVDDDPALERRRVFFHHEFIEPSDWARIADARMDLLLHGTPFDEQFRLLLPDGRLVSVRETARLQFDAAGEPVRYSGSLSDVTAVTAMQERLTSSEAFHRHLIEASNSLIWRTDAAGVLTYVNDTGAREMYGYEPAEMVGRPLLELCAPETARDVLAGLTGEHVEPVRNFEVVHLNKLGRRVYVSVNAMPTRDETGGAVSGAMGINTDITWLKRRERAFQDSVRMQRLIFDSAGEGIVMIRNGRVHRANQAFADLVGATIGDIVARSLSNWFVAAHEWDAVEDQLTRLGNVIKVEQQLRRSDGRALWAAVTGRVAGVEDDVRTYIWVFADISARKEQEEQSWYRANHDELTGLPNRRLLQDRFEQALVRAKRESMRMGVLMLDLDGFKEVNDVHGHNAGDEVLRAVARRLTDNVRQLDTVARLGGDEFVIVLHQLSSAADSEMMATRLIEQIRAPVEFAGKELRVSTSVGISLYPEGGDSIAGLMHTADMAMYAAKASGKDTFRTATAAQRPVRLGEPVDRFADD